MNKYFCLSLSSYRLGNTVLCVFMVTYYTAGILAITINYPLSTKKALDFSYRYCICKLLAHIHFKPDISLCPFFQLP